MKVPVKILRESLFGIFACSLLLGGLVLSGCGGGSTSSSSDSSEEPKTTKNKGSEGTKSASNQTSSEGTSAQSSPENSSSSTSTQEPKSYTDSQGRKWLPDDIPYDVFFDDPLAVAANDQQVAVKDPDSSNMPRESQSEKEDPSEAETAESSGAAGSTDWKTLLPLPILESEVKSIRNHLTQSLQSVGKYNGNYKEVRVNGSTLAALAGIAIEHPEPVSWKENAKYVRDLGADIVESAEGLGRKSFDSTQFKFEQLVVILNGSKPAGLEETASTIPYSEVANRGNLMKRMKTSFEILRKDINNEEVFLSQKEKIQQEAALLSALAKVIATDGYLLAEEKEYQNYVKSMIESCQEMVKATKTESYQNFTEEMSRVQKTCDECHADYRFADTF